MRNKLLLMLLTLSACSKPDLQTPEARSSEITPDNPITYVNIHPFLGLWNVKDTTYYQYNTGSMQTRIREYKVHFYVKTDSTQVYQTGIYGIYEEEVGFYKGNINGRIRVDFVVEINGKKVCQLLPVILMSKDTMIADMHALCPVSGANSLQKVSSYLIFTR